MNAEQKNLVILAGPNGSGKTTIADLLLENRSIEHFINADTIARGLSASKVGGSEIHAGKAMLFQIKQSISRGINVAFESTMAGRSWGTLIRQAQKEGYHVTICYVYLDSERLAVNRVEQRVKEGGHTVSEAVIVRRFHRSLRLFKSYYSPIVESWFLFNNSGDTAALVAYAQDSGKPVIVEKEHYERFLRG